MKTTNDPPKEVAERVQCGRTRACGWIGTEAEYTWIPNRREGSTVAACPECGNTTFLLPDRLSKAESRILEGVRLAFLEATGLQGGTTADVRWHSFRLWDNKTIYSHLNRLSARGHIIKVKDWKGRVRWSIPASKEARP